MVRTSTIGRWTNPAGEGLTFALVSLVRLSAVSRLDKQVFVGTPPRDCPPQTGFVSHNGVEQKIAGLGRPDRGSVDPWFHWVKSPLKTPSQWLPSDEPFSP